ncbi:L-fucose/L-arabinose isomerase family protein [Candidatus Solirubrobacter pratensis]|uniref:L-fucose/L-arabinose isomerase family protein n=1 Tax=Candidatus Solirubrobacter pratensis TaxID=1298857 RepID=UPI0004020183|nr:L-fucose/L-arabinose isomerase family protein [Candidatus Solirubrobacter pratensis]
MTATRTSTASAETAAPPAKPRIGLLGIMQSLYDEMLPGVTERQAAYAAQVAGALADVADVVPAPPVKERADAEAAMRDLQSRGLDGLLVVNLTYGPAMRVARLLAETRLPICLANIQPEPAVTAEWDMADLTYNQGIHGAQDTANAMVRAGRAFHVVTDDWRSPSFAEAIGAWARAAAAVTRWRALRVAVLGYAMNGMGDINVDAHALIRSLGPQVDAVAPGDLVRAAAAISDEAVAELRAAEDARFEVDPALSAQERGDHARMQLGLETLLREGGYGAFSAHFDAIGEDGRFARLPLAAASSLMARGYGYGAEGDALTASLMAAARELLGDTQFTEMYAMDFPSDSILMSHMGEGNWVLAREDRPVRLIKRPLGIGGLGDPPTFLFQYAPGPATLATLIALGGERFRLLAVEGEILDTDELPALEMPYGFFHPHAGVRECMNRWLRLGGPHHQVLNLGGRAAEWEIFCELAGIEFSSL